MKQSSTTTYHTGAHETVNITINSVFSYERLYKEAFKIILSTRIAKNGILVCEPQGRYTNNAQRESALLV